MILHHCQKFLKTGGKIPPGSSKPNLNRAERGAYIHLLTNLSTPAEEFNIRDSTLIIYIDNAQVIDHSKFPKQGKGPNAFHLEDYDFLEVINHYTTHLKTTYNITIHLTHIYSHLENSTKGAKIIKKLGG